jgi:hypothetical protein
MLPAATYAAVVSPVETEKGPVSIQWGPGTVNSPFTAAVSFEVLNGPCAGQKITSFLYFGEKSAERSLESLRACGFTGDDIDKFSDQTPDIECQIVVEHETYQGKTRAKVKWVNAPYKGFTFEQPLDAPSLRKYSAQLKSKLKGIPVVAGKKAERQPPTAATTEDAGSGWNGNDTMPPPSGAPPIDSDPLPF